MPHFCKYSDGKARSQYRINTIAHSRFFPFCLCQDRQGGSCLLYWEEGSLEQIFLSKCIKSVVNLTTQNLSEINILAYIKKHPPHVLI